VVRLLQRAKDEQNWELCKELARFLMALDESGATLRSTLELVELRSPSADPSQEQTHFNFDTTRLSIPIRGRSNGHRAVISPGLGHDLTSPGRRSRDSGSMSPSGSIASPAQQGGGDYFGMGTGGAR
jgi:hypothetical protein